jgi:hypothetical protein
VAFEVLSKYFRLVGVITYMLLGKSATFFLSKGFEVALQWKYGRRHLFKSFFSSHREKAGAQLLTGTGALCTRAIKHGSS